MGEAVARRDARALPTRARRLIASGHAAVCTSSAASDACWAAHRCAVVFPPAMSRAACPSPRTATGRGVGRRPDGGSVSALSSVWAPAAPTRRDGGPNGQAIHCGRSGATRPRVAPIAVPRPLTALSSGVTRQGSSGARPPPATSQLHRSVRSVARADRRCPVGAYLDTQRQQSNQLLAPCEARKRGTDESARAA